MQRLCIQKVLETKSVLTMAFSLECSKESDYRLWSREKARSDIFQKYQFCIAGQNLNSIFVKWALENKLCSFLCLFIVFCFIFALFIMILLIQSFLILHRYPHSHSLPFFCPILLPPPPIHFSERVRLPIRSQQNADTTLRGKTKAYSTRSRLSKVSV